MMIRDMVLQGYGTGLLTRHSVTKAIDAGILREVESRYAFGQICLQMWFRDQYPSAPARAFRDLMTKSHPSESQPWLCIRAIVITNRSNTFSSRMLDS